MVSLLLCETGSLLTYLQKNTSNVMNSAADIWIMLTPGLTTLMLGLIGI